MIPSLVTPYVCHRNACLTSVSSSESLWFT